MVKPCTPNEKGHAMQHDALLPNQPIDIAALTPVERMVLADALYDSAMHEINSAALSPEETAEIDRRIARLESGEDKLVPWDEVYARLMNGR